MKQRIAWLITTGLVASSLAVPGIAAANTTEAIAETGGFSLALPGVGLTVDVMLDDFGHIESVDVLDLATEPELGEDGHADAFENEHKVRFELTEDGTRIAVMAKKHKLTSKVKAGELRDLLGDHVWSAVLFPDLADETTTVTFTVGEDAAGPFLTNVSVSGLPDLADYSIAPVDDADDEDEAKVEVTFTWMGFTKVLKIKLDVDDGDDAEDDGPSAVLKIELRAKDRQRLRQDSIGPFLGSHEWSGLLCDGTPVGVEYVIGADGSVEVVAVSIADDADAADGFSVKEKGKGFELRFDDSKARVRVKFGEEDDGSWELKVDAKTTEKCKHERNGERESGKKDKPRRDRDDRDRDENGDDDD